MPRFYCPQALALGAQIQLPEQVVHHLHVLRLKIGDTVHLFNGEGGAYSAKLISIEKRRADASVEVFLPDEVELPFKLTLAQALPEASKMDWIIEKAIELGATGIQPIASQRCVVRLSAEREEKKLAHWQGIIESATEQCGRNRLAKLEPVQDLNKWIAQPSHDKRIILTPQATQSLADWTRQNEAQTITIMTGPEGGFSEKEEDTAIAQGAIPLAMGARILRTETAGLAAIAIISAAWGGI
jgi:16S rRNA (uracil1498-N3)-methyltransferase